MTDTEARPTGRDHFNDFDLDSKEFADDYEEVLSSLVSKCPVAHSDVAGGYWVVSRYEDVRACAQDWQTFSSEGGYEPGRGGEGGAKLKTQTGAAHPTRHLSLHRLK